MAEIHVLDKHTAELIAAGEVVERPASAVKELLENAIDAGAGQITVTIENGGVRFLEISDDGCGIDTDQIDKAFIRHATSKIATAEDLDHIHTLGFRGEALASIASVAKVEVLTKTADEEFACDYRIEGGETCSIETGARGTGTTIRVRDLFYNTPARMKFLKKDSSEGTFVADVVNHAALSHPEISFKFVREGKVQYVAPGDGKLMSAAYAVLGREFARGLLAVDDTSGNYHVCGLVTPPKGCRASRGMQLFYINGRYIKNRTIMAAMETAFKGTAMQGKFPGGILMISMPAELVDVNVHPAKTEVRFARENDVFDAVYHAVKLALAQPGSGECLFSFPGKGENAVAADGAQDGAGKAESPAEQAAQDAVKQEYHTGLSAVVPAQSEPGALKHGISDEDILTEENAPAALGPDTRLTMHSPACAPTAFRTAAADERGLDILPGADEAAPQQALFGAYKGKGQAAVPEDSAQKADKTNIFTAVPGDITENSAAMPGTGDVTDTEPEFSNELGTQQTTFLDEPQTEPLQYVGELFRTYIVAQRGEDEVCLIDKHAAHERILYEQLAKHYGDVAGQMLLAPVAVELTAEEKQAVLDNAELLCASGFEADDFGGNTVAVRQVPCDVEPDDIESLTVELAAKLAKGSRDALSEKTEWVLHSIACRAAIKAGDRTDPVQLIALAEQILSGAVPPFCPHGRPCVLKLTRKELEKQFGRIV
ncbi:MAG: DNA mismatch repair endonuclease MutL [Faecalibacterium sp.]|jgi:DNA mismatch repair protein MutL|nr:DNA mismatch repair endonuclease MutL [Faecalibacterium sp.]